MFCIAGSQWYSLKTNGFYSPGASILCPAFAIFIVHAGFFPDAWTKNEIEEDKHSKQYARRQLLTIIFIIIAFGFGFANLWLMRFLLK